MKTFLITLFFSYTLTVFAQDYPDSGFTNKAEAKNLMVNGLKEGKWIEYLGYNKGDTLDFVSDRDAPYYHLTVYKTGIPYGIARGYTHSGKLEIEVPYINGRKNGIIKLHDEEGKLYTERIESNDTITMEKEFNKSGKLIAKTLYTNGVPGKEIFYDDYGNEIR